MDVEVIKNRQSGRSIAVRQFAFSRIELFAICDKNNKLLGSAWVGIEERQEDYQTKIAYWLLDLNIYEEAERRKGAASEVIELMQYRYPKIITGISTKAGRELCLKHNFQWIKSTHKKQPDFLFWEKDEYNQRRD